MVKLIRDESPLCFLNERHDCSFFLVVKCYINKRSISALDTVLEVIKNWKRSVYLRAKIDFYEPVNHALSSKEHRSVKTIDLCNSSHTPDSFFSSMSQKYPELVSLYLTKCDLDSRHLSRLAQITAEKGLLKLSTLDMSQNPGIGGNLCVLLCNSFPSLHTFILRRCVLNRSDVHSLTEAKKRERLPKLKNLDVSFNFNPHLFCHSVSNVPAILPALFYVGVPKLNTLIVSGCWLEYNNLYQLYRRAIGDGDLFSTLTTFDMTFNPEIEGYLSEFMCHYFPQLSILVLRKCKLNSDDLCSLAQASSQDRLPELRHLDISENNIGCETGYLTGLFAKLQSFPSLINLMLCDCRLQLQDLCCLTQAKLDDKLPRIRHLDISFNGLSDHVGILSRDPITQREISWGNVICYDEKDRTLSECNDGNNCKDDSLFFFFLPTTIILTRF